MSRKSKGYKREVPADAKFGEKSVTKFVNTMMWSGKRSVSEGIFYGAMDLIGDRFSESGVDVFLKAVDNVRPMVEVRSRRVGGANYQVPTEVRPVRQQALAYKWLIQNARSRGEKTMQERLANELYEASQNRGGAIKKKEDTHRMAEANRAFAHYRW